MKIAAQPSHPVPKPGVARPGAPRALLWMALFALLATLFALGYWPRHARARRLAAAAQRAGQQLPAVAVAEVKRAPAEIELNLPGTVQAWVETPIYARADGYVRRRLVDIGDRVAAGQLLAEIESPELDQQILEAEAALRRTRSAAAQAEAALAQARANMELAEVTAKRWQTLVAKGVLPKQEGDEKQAAWLARKADVAAAEANLRAAREAITAAEASLQRLRELRNFRQVRAPFTGVITARNVDVGTLVTAGSSTAVREMYRLAQIHPLRVHVSVPQSEAAHIRIGLACEVEIEQLAGRSFPGRVTRTANALDPTSRTLLTEIRVENPTGALLPGMYATVRFRLQRAQPPLLMPSGAYRNTEKGPVVAVLASDGTVRFAQVRLGRDFGTQIEVLSGLEAGQKVVTNLSDAIRPGVKVRVIAPAKRDLQKQGERP